jgi:hypothetical protein
LRWTRHCHLGAGAQLPLDDVELEMMEAGGALLLPCSMRAPWQGWLRAADEARRPTAAWRCG